MQLNAFQKILCSELLQFQNCTCGISNLYQLLLVSAIYENFPFLHLPYDTALSDFKSLYILEIFIYIDIDTYLKVKVTYLIVCVCVYIYICLYLKVKVIICRILWLPVSTIQLQQLLAYDHSRLIYIPTHFFIPHPQDDFIANSRYPVALSIITKVYIIF